MKKHLCNDCKHSFIDSDSINGMVIYRIQACRKFEMEVTPYVDGDEMEECFGYEKEVSP